LSRADQDSTDDFARLAPIPRDRDGQPVFAEPWEAQAFAMVLSLHRAGVFTWSEWGAALGAAIRQAQAAGDRDYGSTAYRHWLSALERLVVEKGVSSEAGLADRRAEWDRAAHATPHGEPVVLANAMRGG